MNIFESLENLPVSESCFDDILGLVEELILERNQENRKKKRKWELGRTEAQLNADGEDVKSSNILKNQYAIRQLRKNSKPGGYFSIDNTVDTLASNNRAALGRNANEVSKFRANEYNKHLIHGTGMRKTVSRRGSTKDFWATMGDPLHNKPKYVKDDPEED